MKRLFITGTGTGVGKTAVTAALARALLASGRSVVALKPIASGVDPRALGASDPGVLLEALGQEVTPEAVAALCPWCFEAPLAPDAAAVRAGRALDYDALLAFCAAARADVVLVEGVGGVRVPIARTRTVVDWIAALRAPALLVAGTYLGSLSHTLTALDALARAGVEVRGLVLNRSAEEPMPPGEMIEALAPFHGGLPVVVLPRLGDPRALSAADLLRLV